VLLGIEILYKVLSYYSNFTEKWGAGREDAFNSQYV
jgi:hypothetical protein